MQLVVSFCAIVEQSFARSVLGSSPGSASSCILSTHPALCREFQCATLLPLVVDPTSRFSKPAIPETNDLESILQDLS